MVLKGYGEAVRYFDGWIKVLKLNVVKVTHLSTVFLSSQGFYCLFNHTVDAVHSETKRRSSRNMVLYKNNIELREAIHNYVEQDRATKNTIELRAKK